MKAATLLSAGALAIAAACLTAPNVAAAADHQDRQEKGDRGGWSGRSNDHPAPQARPAQPSPAQSSQRLPGWGGRDRAAQAPAPRAPDAGSFRGRPAAAPADNNALHNWGRSRDQAGSQPRDRYDRGDRNVRNDQPARGSVGQSWNRGDNDRDRNRDRDRDQRNQAWRNNNHDRNDRVDNRRAYNNWDRNSWRHNDRYDWQRYRDGHRSVYRIGRYYAPYSRYSYRRIGIGFTLGSLFYGNRYWIDDPWYYRLPEVYGPYRWVRYYDDVLLVNVYTGEVVDVIYDFFW